MRIAKAVILAGPDGDEPSWPAVVKGPRQLVPVANQPILFHQLEHLRRAGLLEATIIVDAQAVEPIRKAIGNGGRWDLVIRFAECQGDRGLAGVLSTCRSFIGDEPILVQHADALLRDRLVAHINAFADDRLDAMALRVAGPPAGEASALPPGYMLSPRALALLIEHPDAAANPINEIRASGGRVRVESVDGCLPCHGDIDALLDCNRRLLEELVGNTTPIELPECEVQGAVVVHPSADVRRSTLRGPLIIGPRAKLDHAYVGPYSSVGADVVIEGAEIEYSMVLPGAELAFVGTRIESSVIGEGARVAREFRKPGSLRLSVGDGAEVLFP